MFYFVCHLLVYYSERIGNIYGKKCYLSVIFAITNCI